MTLIGPGGTGKTRLAVETAHRLAAEGREVRLVELAPVADATRLPEVFIDAIGSGESILTRRAEDPRTRLTDALWGRDLIVAVDNCEHLIENVAELLAHLLARVPGLRVLATSREALGITGEAVLGVGPLPLPERREQLADLRSHAAIRLFEERARQSDPEFAVDAANADTVLQVCTALDGLPLAIELAAARLRAMCLEDLAARLDDRFGLLARGPRTAEPRQRTLRAVVDWSWELLTPQERLVLARMSVFSGGADLEAACEVCSAHDDEITGLVEKSLVQRLPGGRYRLLETVREYAAARLAEAGETAERFERHALHYARLAEEAEPHLMRAEQVEWLDRIGTDHGNFFAAIRRMVAAGNARVAYRALAPLSWYWWMRGYRQEGQELAVQVRALPDDDPAEPLHRAKVAMAGSWGLWSGRLDPSEIDAEFEMAQRLSEEYDLFETEPMLWMIPLIRSLMAGDEDAVRAIADDLDPAVNPWVRGIALLFVCDYSYREGRAEQAAAELAESNAIFERLGDRFGIILSLQGLAGDRMAAGDYPGARGLLVRAIAAEAEFGADLADSVIVESLWRIDAEHGDDPEAILERMRVVEQRAERIGNAENVIAARVAASICLRRLGKLTEARDEMLDAEAHLPQFVGFAEIAIQLYRQLEVDRPRARRHGPAGPGRRHAHREQLAVLQLNAFGQMFNRLLQPLASVWASLRWRRRLGSRERRHRNGWEDATSVRNEKGHSMSGIEKPVIKRRIAAAAAAAGLAAIASLGLAAPAQAGGYAQCGSGYVCMWEDAGFQGDEWVHWKPSGVGAKYNIDGWDGDNEISSIYNHSGYALRIYANDDYTGESICIGRGGDRPALKDQSFNDDAESAKTVSSC